MGEIPADLYWISLNFKINSFLLINILKILAIYCMSIYAF